MVNPDLSLIESVDRKYWKHEAGSIVEMAPTEKSMVDADAFTKITYDRGTSADNQVDSNDSVGMVIRAFAEVMVDEINLLRAEHSLTPKTVAQLKNAIKNKIIAGNAD